MFGPHTEEKHHYFSFFFFFLFSFLNQLSHQMRANGSQRLSKSESHTLEDEHTCPTTEDRGIIYPTPQDYAFPTMQQISRSERTDKAFLFVVILMKVYRFNITCTSGKQQLWR